MLFVWGAGISASRESSSDSIYLAHGVFVVSVLQGRSAPTDVFEWNRTNNGVDDLPGAMSWSIVPLRTLASWPSPMHITFSPSSLLGWMLVIVKTTWSRPRSVYCSFWSLARYLSLCGDQYELAFDWTNLHRWPTWTSSSIMPFSAWHLSIVWPKLRWYWQCLDISAFLGICSCFRVGISLACSASSRILSLAAFNGV